MRLEKFRIINCFGFEDSEDIQIASPNNLTYFLGKNSSGKTSVLTALSAMEPSGSAPKEYARFYNYQDAQDNPERILKATFRAQDHSSLPEFSARGVVQEVMDLFPENLVTLGATEEGLTATQRTQQGERPHQAITNLVNAVHEKYKELIDEIKSSLQVIVEKAEDGHYRFLASDKDYEQYKARRNEISQKWAACKSNNNAVNIGGNLQQINFSFEAIEDSFFNQLPEILPFHKRLSVQVDLPRTLTSDNVRSPDNTLTRALIERLGQNTLQELLRVNITREVEEIQQELNSKLSSPSDEINAATSASGGDELVQLRIRKGSPGEIQLSVATDTGEQWYEHISDNTKFLISYHILKNHRFRHNTPYAVLLFDEPNQGFHPSAEGKLLQFLESLAQQGKQVVITTHSQHMIDLDMLGGVRIMDRDRRGLKVHNNFWGASGPSRNTLALQPIAEAIGLRYSDQLVDYRSTVVVEGYADLLYIRRFAQLLGLEPPNMAPVTGQQKIVTLLSFLISQGVPFKVAVDERQKKNQLKKDLNVENGSCFVVEEHIGGSQSQAVGIEDPFSRDDYRQILTSSGHTINDQELPNVSNSGYAKNNGLKRILANSVYEDESLSIEDFDSTTTENFKSLLEFCNNENWSSP